MLITDRLGNFRIPKKSRLNIKKDYLVMCLFMEANLQDLVDKNSFTLDV